MVYGKPRRNAGRERLVRIGLTALYNRKRENNIRYVYRKVGKNPRERYSFRWQPRFTPDNQTDDEYLKKRLFSWTVKRRANDGTLTPSRTKDNWPKKHRKSRDWRAAHYFWSYKRGGQERRMMAQTKDPNVFMQSVAAYYDRYIRLAGIPTQSKQAFNSLIALMKHKVNRDIEVDTKMDILRSDDAIAASTEEALIYLAPELHKRKIREDPENKQITRIIAAMQNRRAHGKQQIDVLGGSKEAKNIESFLKSKEKEIITEAGHLRQELFTKLDAGVDVSERNIFARFSETVPYIAEKKNAKYLRSMDKQAKYAEYKNIIMQIRTSVLNNYRSSSGAGLAGESRRRLGLEKSSMNLQEAKGRSYLFILPTGAGDLIALKIRESGGKPNIVGGIIPNVRTNLGIASTQHVIGANKTSRAMKVIQALHGTNTLMMDGELRAYNVLSGRTLESLFGRDSTTGETVRMIAPTYGVSVIPHKRIVAGLADLVEGAFGEYYGRGTWERMFDPQDEKQGTNNMFRRWATQWTQQSMALTRQVNRAADSDVKWMPWMKNKVKTKVSPFSWAAPVHIRPFIVTDKTGNKQFTAARNVTATDDDQFLSSYGEFETRMEAYKDNLSRM